MLMVVKNQIKVSILSIKYSLMREMLNKTTFIMNVIFMILNNACFIVQWIILYSIKENVGGYSFKQILLLWGIAASTYGISRFFFKKSFSLSDTINQGKIDSVLVQPKNVLISLITTDVETSALGDMIYGYIMLFLYGFSIKRFILFTIFSITGAIIITSVAIILGSLSFWINKSDIISDTGNNLILTFATYPDGIFKGLVKILLYTVIPIGFVSYIPIQVITTFNLSMFLSILIITVFFVVLAFIVFYRGLRRYSSTNLMSLRI